MGRPLTSTLIGWLAEIGIEHSNNTTAIIRATDLAVGTVALLRKTTLSPSFSKSFKAAMGDCLVTLIIPLNLSIPILGHLFSLADLTDIMGHLIIHGRRSTFGKGCRAVFTDA